METSENPPQKLKKHRQSFATLFNLVLLAILVLGVNYLAWERYTKKDLTQDSRYSLSGQTLNFLKSDLLQDYKHPVKVIFAFRRNTDNYPRMRSLLEDYAYNSGGKIELECLDPVRSPNRAREIANIYGLEFTQNLVIVDARPDTGKVLGFSDEEIKDASHVRFLPSSSFVVYERSADGKTQKAVALQMEDIVTSGLIGAVEGIPRPIYLIVDKSKLGKEDKQDPTSLFSTIDKISRQLNLQLIPMRISEASSVPENAAGVMLIGPQYDLEDKEMETLREYWSRPNAALFVMLDPAAGPLSKVNILLRENGIRPRVDKIMKKASKGAVFEINAVFTPGPIMTQDFWNASTLLEGQSTSLKVEEGDERLAIQRINPFPLLEAGHEYYGETKPQQAPAKYDVGEDYDSPLAVAAGVERGNANDVTHAKQTSRLSVITNMEMINPQKVRPDQRDFIKAVLFWLTDREKLGGIGSRNDLTVKIPWDERTKSIVELLAVIALPLLALFMAFLLWRSRRS